MSLLTPCWVPIDLEFSPIVFGHHHDNHHYGEHAQHHLSRVADLSSLAYLGDRDQHHHGDHHAYDHHGEHAQQHLSRAAGFSSLALISRVSVLK